jgi:hypothetical protein
MEAALLLAGSGLDWLRQVFFESRIRKKWAKKGCLGASFPKLPTI